MKKYIIKSNLLLLGFMIVMTQICCESKQISTANKIVDIPIIEYNFGAITHKDSVAYTFIIKNTNSQPITITKVLPNCKCTITHANIGKILPNHKTSIEALFIPKKDQHGAVSASILVEGDFNNGITELKMVGHVKD